MSKYDEIITAEDGQRVIIFERDTIGADHPPSHHLLNVSGQLERQRSYPLRKEQQHPTNPALSVKPSGAGAHRLVN